MDQADIENRFTYHAPTAKDGEKYRSIRYQALRFARDIDMLCPDSREKALAITHLEEVVFWANASIARS